MGHYRHNLSKLPRLELAKVQDCQSMFHKLAKLPRLEPAIFQELLQLISLSLTLIQENGIDLFWNHFFKWYVRIKKEIAWNLQ